MDEDSVRLNGSSIGRHYPEERPLIGKILPRLSCGNSVIFVFPLAGEDEGEGDFVLE
jgi:hypothetical protein